MASKKQILNDFISEARTFCEHYDIQVIGIRQSYYEAKPVVSFWVDSKYIDSITFRRFKRGDKYSVVVKEAYVEAYIDEFGEPSATVGNKNVSHTWMTYNQAQFIKLALYDESPTSLEDLFNAELENTYSTLGRTVQYWPKRFIRSVREHGAVNHAKKALANRKQDGFEKLIEIGRTDLSLECIVLKHQFQSLFTASELREAKRRLETIPEYAFRKDVIPENNFSGEITPIEATIFNEGSKQTVIVNKYERNPKARQACLLKHGYKCQVCEFSFFERFGDIGKDFIHVHHKNPLASIAKGYEIDAEKDLIPVCPNCHAMLHTKNPPLSVEELKSILEEQMILTKDVI